MSSIVHHPGAALLSEAAKWISGADVLWLWRPLESQPRVYYANHASHLDALVVLAALPAPVRGVTRPVACQEYWQGTRLKAYLARRVFGAVLIPRAKSAPFAGRAILSTLLGELERGCSLILFPEGTRGAGEEIADFRSGIFQLCREREGLEAVPVYLENLNLVLPKGRLLPAPAKSRVVFGRPLRLTPGETRPDFLRRARVALQDLRRV
jgi:1-acyl-sn-glycerol-3-phosphate acyltransferase